MGARNSGVPSNMRFPIFIPGANLKITGICFNNSLLAGELVFKKQTIESCHFTKKMALPKTQCHF